MAKKGLLERLADGPVICAEGYLFELERRGYLQAGAYVPEVVLDFPEQVENLHRDFLRAGSDVIEAFTYYAHREKLRLIGREDDLEPMNRQALAIAKKVAAEGDALVAGNICNTNVYKPDDAEAARQVRAMYEEQVAWAIEAGVDFIIAETISWLGEAEIALDVIRQTKLPSVVTFALHKKGEMRDGFSPAEAAKRIEGEGADVVGLNCIRGIRTMMPHVDAIRRAVKIHVAALPVPYRTTRGRADLRVAHREGRSLRALHPGRALLPGRARPVPGDALRDRRVRPRTPPPWTCATSASAAGPGRTTSGRSPRRSGGARRRAASRPTCRSTTPTAMMHACGRRTANTRKTCDASRRRAGSGV